MVMYLPEPKTGGEDFTPAPEGVHRAVCVSVIDLGTQEQTPYQGKPRAPTHKIQIRWELADELMPDGKFKGQPFTVSKRFTYSTSEKADLRKTLESWRGKKFEASDFGPGGFSVDKLLGVSCMLQIVHEVREGKTYANIAGVMPMPKGMAKAAPSMEPFILSLDPENYEQDLFEGLGERLKETIAKSPEFQEVQRRRKGVVTAAPPMTQPSAGLTADLDDEIPF